MKITFLLPNIALRGGVRAVIEYADLLAGMGQDVTVVFPTRLAKLPFGLNELEYLWRAPHKLWFGRWFSTRARVIAVPSLHPRYIPRADILVATAWQTAEWAAGYPSNRGTPHYYIQDIETYAADEHAHAARTYTYPFRRIVTSPWIRDELARRFDARTHALVPLGIDLQLYRPAAKTRTLLGPIVIGTLYNGSRRKGFDIAMRVMERTRREIAGIQWNVLGVPPRAEWSKIVDECVDRLPPEQTPSFYQTCDVWLCPSRSEGFYLPGLEAMASGCALVTTSIGGTVYYAIPERTALVCNPGDEDGLVAALVRACRDVSLRRRLIDEGVRHVQQFDQLSSARNLLRALSGEEFAVEPQTGLEARHCA